MTDVSVRVECVDFQPSKVVPALIYSYTIYQLINVRSVLSRIQTDRGQRRQERRNADLALCEHDFTLRLTHAPRINLSSTARAQSPSFAATNSLDT